ncbi:predicted protein, partial [Nematostella vectensis]
MITALFFTGFGNITPQTPTGRALTIVYCLVGLPLSALATKSGGDVVIHLVCLAETFIFRLVFRTPVSRHRLRLSLVIGVTLVAVFLCLMAGIGMYLDNRTFLDSFYAWFITFTTIGFGDFV